MVYKQQYFWSHLLDDSICGQDIISKFLTSTRYQHIFLYKIHIQLNLKPSLSKAINNGLLLASVVLVSIPFNIKRYFP